MAEQDRKDKTTCHDVSSDVHEVMYVSNFKPENLSFFIYILSAVAE